MAEPVSVRVINLERSRERRAFIENDLKATGIESEFFRAIDGDQAALAFHDQLRPGRLSPGEAGCFGSHYSLWRECASQDRTFIIMEDDVRLQDISARAFGVAGALTHRFGLIRLFGIFPRRSVPVAEVDGFHVVRFLSGPAGTQCYALSPRAARTLVAHSSRWSVPVDEYVDRFWVHGLPSIALTPFAVSPSKGIASIIRDGAPAPAGQARVFREIARFGHRLRREAYNLRFRWAGDG